LGMQATRMRDGRSALAPSAAVIPRSSIPTRSLANPVRSPSKINPSEEPLLA
jgi:hypothetical protein